MTRKVYSIKTELVNKASEAAMSAVQIFNNPNILFKSESFIVLINIAWTYLMHAYYKSIDTDYRYFTENNGRKRFDRTKYGDYKYWVLETCINKTECPLDNDTKNNLRFIIGIRHEIEHKMALGLDDVLSARFQACCINFNHYIKKLFGDEYGIDKHLAFSLQFSSISIEQKDMLQDHDELPKNVLSYINDFDEALSKEEYDNPRFAYRMLFVPKTANRKGQADRVIEFVKSDSDLAKDINAQYVVIKEKEKAKYRPSDIVVAMEELGYEQFSMHWHTKLWKENDAKNPSKGYGVEVSGQWYWYQNWFDFVRKHCEENYEKEG